jgi:phosphoribosylamine--glycine ligase
MLSAMRAGGSPFSGLLYCGLMLTPAGPRVVEFNARFGDPETQVVLPMMESPLLDLLMRCAGTGPLDAAAAPVFSSGAAVTTVVASPGYPESPETGQPIDLSSVPGDVLLFHAGTARSDGGELVTAGGRVLAVTAVASTIAEAQARSRDGAAAVQFPGRQFRGDIGWREQQRRAGAS